MQVDPEFERAYTALSASHTMLLLQARDLQDRLDLALNSWPLAAWWWLKRKCRWSV